MIPRRAWTILAFAQPALVALVLSLASRRFAPAVWCYNGLSRLVYWYVARLTVPCLLVAGAIALAFILRALCNRRLSWGMRAWWATAILLFSPVMVPAYWVVHLRRS